jgi:hypothetical protein
MRQRVRIPIVSLGIVLLLAGMGITLLAVWKPERIIQEKRESEWLRCLNNVARATPIPKALDRSSDLHRAWEKLGPEATPILVKAAKSLYPQ